MDIDETPAAERKSYAMGFTDGASTGFDARQNLLDNIEQRIDFYLDKIARARDLRRAVKFGGYLPAEIYEELGRAPLT